MDNTAAAIAPFLNKVNDAVVNPAIAVLFVVATAVFMWGIVKFIANADNESERSEGKQNMVYGIIGMFIMVSVFFIMQMIVNTFDLDENDQGIDPIDFVVEAVE